MTITTLKTKMNRLMGEYLESCDVHGGSMEEWAHFAIIECRVRPDLIEIVREGHDELVAASARLAWKRPAPDLASGDNLFKVNGVPLPVAAAWRATVWNT